MYDRSNGTATGQVFDFMHLREDGLLSGVQFILPVAKLKKKPKQTFNK